jgi:hypothetical protein
MLGPFVGARKAWRRSQRSASIKISCSSGRLTLRGIWGPMTYGPMAGDLVELKLTILGYPLVN